MLLTVLLCACGSGAGQSGEPTTPVPDQNTPSAPGPAPADTLPLAISSSWQPPPTWCRANESLLAVAPTAVNHLRVCWAPDRGAARLINISDTTLLLQIGGGHSVHVSPPATETGIAEEALRAGQLTGGYYADGTLVMPARFSAVVDDGRNLGNMSVTGTDTRHGQRVAQTRIVADLTAQLPYAKLGTLLRTKGAWVASCAGQSLIAANDKHITLKEAIESTRTCNDMVTFFRGEWEKARQADIRVGRAAHPAAPVAEDLLGHLAAGAAPAERNWATISEEVLPGAVRLLARRHP
jgi:hypothetical protein